MVLQQTWVNMTIGLVWLLNIGLGTATYFFFTNWAAFVWIMGSVKWAVILELACIVCLLYLGCIGFCVLGSEKNMISSYKGAPHAMSSFGFVLPIIIFSLFFAMSLCALISTTITNKYIIEHSDEVFERADTNHDDLLDNYEFQQYALHLPQYQGHNDTATRDSIMAVFEGLDKDGDGFVTELDMERGVLDALLPARRRFGAAVLTVALVAIGFTIIFWIWRARLKREQDLLTVDRDDHFLDK